jgi:hypothetical protein
MSSHPTSEDHDKAMQSWYKLGVLVVDRNINIIFTGKVVAAGEQVGIVDIEDMRNDTKNEKEINGDKSPYLAWDRELRTANAFERQVKHRQRSTYSIVSNHSK